MHFTYSHHAECRLNDRCLTAQQVVEEFWRAPVISIHNSLTQKDLIIDGQDIRVIAQRIHKGCHIITVHFID